MFTGVFAQPPETRYGPVTDAPNGPWLGRPGVARSRADVVSGPCRQRRRTGTHVRYGELEHHRVPRTEEDGTFEDIELHGWIRPGHPRRGTRMEESAL
jgi:hypothetical protein